MAIMTAYVDSSGSNKEADISATAICVSTVMRWKRYEREWNQLRTLHGFEHFHMTEFVGCRKERWCRECQKGKKTEQDHPWREWSEPKRETVIRSLAAVIADHVDYGFGVAITKEDYRKYVLHSPSRKFAGEPIGDLGVTHSLQVCGGQLGKWRAKRLLIGEPLNWVFDTTDHKDERAEISKIFFGPTDDGVRIQDGVERWFVSEEPISFASRKKLVQLLAPDMLSYVAAKMRLALVGKYSLRDDVFNAGDVLLHRKNKNIQIGFISQEEMQRLEAMRMQRGSNEE